MTLAKCSGRTLTAWGSAAFFIGRALPAAAAAYLSCLSIAFAQGPWPPTSPARRLPLVEEAGSEALETDSEGRDADASPENSGGETGPELLFAPPGVRLGDGESSADENVNDDKQNEAAVVEAETAVVEVPPAEGFFIRFINAWHGSLQLGLGGTEGNSTTFNVQAGAKAAYNGEFFKNTLEANHVDKSQNGKKTALNTLIDFRAEHLFRDTNWSIFFHNLDEFDEFKKFDVRISADAGLGYRWLKSDAATLITRLGGSVSREIGGPDDRFKPELSSGLEFKSQLNDRTKFTAKADYFPDVTDFTDFRLNSRAEWELIVAPKWGLSLKLSVIDRYDSTPVGGFPNDLDYSALMLWSF